MNHTKNATWNICVDTGGTFTDCIAISPSGDFRTSKVLSSASLRGVLIERLEPGVWKIDQSWKTVDGFPLGFPIRVLGKKDSFGVVSDFKASSSILKILINEDTEPEPGTEFELVTGLEAPVLAAHLITGTPANRRLPDLRMRLATTRATNALLERKGVTPVFFVTKGFGDLLLIGDQTRPDLFAVNVVKPEPLTGRVVEVEERLDSDGNILKAFDSDSLRKSIFTIPESERETAAVVLMNSYMNPDHEIEVAQILKETGFHYISVSSQLSPAIRILERAQTTVANAYLEPIIRKYLDRVEAQTGTESLKGLTVMSSAGGLHRPAEYQAKDSLLSGPAGGIVGATQAGNEVEHDRCISFDMGGTSTDVARIEGGYPYVSEHRVGDAHLLAPAFEIHTVAAGGGSICRVEKGEILVGPESAGSWPGPACYGAGGPLSITDVNLLLGRILPEQFEIPISIEAARKAAEAEWQNLDKTNRISLPELLEGFVLIANQIMANAIRQISVQQGYDPSEYIMISFGGAGSQHACGVADELEIRKVLIPLNASLLSAEGLYHSRMERIMTRQLLRPLSESVELLKSVVTEMEREAERLLKADGVADCSIVSRLLDLRLQGQDSTLTVTYDDSDPAISFKGEFRRVYGYEAPEREIEIAQLRIIASESTGQRELKRELPETGFNLPDRTRILLDGEERDGVVHSLQTLATTAVEGPCLIAAHKTVVWVDTGWRATLNGAMQVELEKGTES